MQERQTRIASADRAHLQPAQKIVELEEQIKPPDSILAYRALIEAGLPEQEARKRLYHTLLGAKFFVDLASATPQLYFPKEQFEGLFSENPLKRSDAAMHLGLSYIYASLSMLIDPQEVASNIHPLVKLIAMECLTDHLLPEIKRESPNVDIEMVKDTLFAALSKDSEEEKPHFAAAGGRFLVLFPNQTQTTAEFATGNEFDAQIQAFLVIPIIQKFIDLMGANFMTSGARYRVPEAAITRAFHAKNKLDSIDMKVQGEILDGHLNSDLPFLFLAAHKQGLIVK